MPIVLLGLVAPRGTPRSDRLPNGNLCADRQCTRRIDVAIDRIIIMSVRPGRPHHHGIVETPARPVVYDLAARCRWNLRACRSRIVKPDMKVSIALAVLTMIGHMKSVARIVRRSTG